MTKKPFNAPKRGGSIVIQNWMVKAYELQGDNLLVYALIHSFSKDGKGVFYGSLRYFSFWTGKSKPTILKSLHYLLVRGFIIKKKIPYTRMNQNRYYCEYWTSFSRLNEAAQKEILRSTN